ncbi:hypothetical protein [Paraferrimonas sedimenticola]|uniref:Terminase small subunit n=1 Tax=Paraferrimonas sedimenticola TaxID=375674 RepID=A0AA37VTI6_9GAMM|nr:hypothetical protein [Paraferrimonas sedimenticola]GLP95349.1 hypothetical protein GCM10007895_06550 [Paraferrimonas sedimenticola]
MKQCDERELLFVEAYVNNNGKAAPAAIVAGWKESYARRFGPDIAQRPHVAAAINQKRLEVLNDAKSPLEWKLRILKQVAENGARLGEDGTMDNPRMVIQAVEAMSRLDGDMSRGNVDPAESIMLPPAFEIKRVPQEKTIEHKGAVIDVESS